MQTPKITFRPVESDDSAFLLEVYSSTRREELAQATDWSEAQRRAFLAQQFEFQTKDWARVHPRARREIIVLDGRDAGRLYTNRSVGDADLRVIDIALLPAFRNRGVATRIFTDLFSEADEQGWKVSIHVEHQNPAKNLYARLGFGPVLDRGVYLLMARAPMPKPSFAEAVK